MNKISSIVRIQAHLQFQQQRKKKLKAILSEQQKSKGSDSFQEILNLYLQN